GNAARASGGHCGYARTRCNPGEDGENRKNQRDLRGAQIADSVKAQEGGAGEGDSTADEKEAGRQYPCRRQRADAAQRVPDGGGYAIEAGRVDLVRSFGGTPQDVVDFPIVHGGLPTRVG